MNYREWFDIIVNVEANFATRQMVHTAQLILQRRISDAPGCWVKQTFDIDMDMAAQEEHFMHMLEVEFHGPLMAYFDKVDRYCSDQMSRPMPSYDPSDPRHLPEYRGTVL